MLASRLGVAALIIIALSFFTGNRPLIQLQMDDDGPTTAEADDRKIRIGPLILDHRAPLSDEDRRAIRESMAALREADILDEETLEALEARMNAANETLEIESMAREAEALGADSLEIARQLAATQVETPNESRPDRLSESEIQSLVVQRLLSVQTQIREDEVASSPSSSNAATPSPSGTTSRVPVVMDDPVVTAPRAQVVPTAPPAPDVSAAPRPKRTLERITGNFSGLTLMGTDFRNKDLSGLDFSNARLTASEFNGSDLTGANFSGAKLHGASFTDAIMDDVNLANAQAQTAHFERASMLRANLNHANFAGAVLTNADLRGATMESLNLNGANLEGTLRDKVQ